MQRGQEGDICAYSLLRAGLSASKIISEVWVSEMWLPTVLWAMRNQISLDCCENDCHLTTNSSLQFSDAQTPVVYQISPPSGIPGTGPFFKLEPTLIIIWCSILSFSLWGICLAGDWNRHFLNLMSKLMLNRKMGLHKGRESAALGTRVMHSGQAIWYLASAAQLCLGGEMGGLNRLNFWVIWPYLFSNSLKKN